MGPKVLVGDDSRVRFLTFSCYKRFPLLHKDRPCRWLAEALDQARGRLRFEIWAYVFMPEHVHILVWLGSDDTCTVDRIRAAAKRPVSVRAKRHLVETGATRWLCRLTVQKGCRAEFRFWQKGPGFDEPLTSDRAVEDVIDYIHANPVRRGLSVRPTDWYWSSARAYAGFDDVPLRIDRPRL